MIGSIVNSRLELDADSMMEAVARVLAAQISELEPDRQQDLVVRVLDYLGPGVQTAVCTTVYLMLADEHLPRYIDPDHGPACCLVCGAGCDTCGDVSKALT